MFDSILGNDRAKGYLSHMIQKGYFGHSLLFAGPAGVGKSLFAHALAQAILTGDGEPSHKFASGNHPDIRLYRPEGKLGMHSIEAMRSLSEEVYLAPYEAKKKIFIIHDADRMLPTSSNALLKTFEEPGRDSIIILLSDNPEALIPTILSRCRKIYFQSIAETEIAAFVVKRYGKSSDDAARIAALAQGSLGRACQLAEQEGESLRDKVLQVLARGRLNSYEELSLVVSALAGQVEAAKKELDAEARQQLSRGEHAEMMAVQLAQLEKEVDGAVSMKYLAEANFLFNTVLSWHRDLHLMQVKGNTALVLNRDYHTALEQAYKRGDMLPLEQVEKVVSEAKLALSRSTALAVCLENVFLKINIL